MKSPIDTFCKYVATVLSQVVFKIDLSETIIVSCFAQLVATLNRDFSNDILIIVLGM